MKNRRQKSEEEVKKIRRWEDKKSQPLNLSTSQLLPLLLTVYCLLFTVLSGCATVSVEEQKEADFHYKMGISYLIEGNVQMAYVQLQKALQLDPNNKEILNSLGLVYLQLEEFAKAKDLFIRAISMDREFSDAHYNLGVTYTRTTQWQEAVEAFKKALSNPLYQTPERAFYYLGITYYRIRQFDLAINAFKDSIKRSPLSPLPYYGLALAYNKTSRYGDASAAITRAIEVDPAYKGDRKRFVEDIRQRLLTAKGEDEIDFRDYLEIMRY